MQEKSPGIVVQQRQARRRGVGTIGRMKRHGTKLLAILALAAVVLIAFGLSVAPDTPDTVTGRVVRVESASVTTIASLTLVDDSGEQWVFEGAGSFAGFTPSHLEEHRALGEGVTVEYEMTAAGTLTILGITD
jgi:hypothetical protein